MISKNLAQVIGASIVPLVLLMLPLLLIGFIWTEFGDIVFSTRMISDGAIMAVLLITGHILALKLGKDGGKLDDDYIKAKNTYEQLTEDIYKVGTLYLGAFCLWQVDLEYEEAIRVRLFGLKVPPKEWSTVKNMSYDFVIIIGKEHVLNRQIRSQVDNIGHFVAGYCTVIAGSVLAAEVDGGVFFDRNTL